MRYFISLCFVVSACLSGCAVNPITGQSELSLMTPEQEVAIGAENYQPSLQSQGGIYTVDPALSAYVSKLGQALAAKSHQPNLPYEFAVINNDVPNAWALPGGKIAINRGLLLHLEDESQLAAVLGHEIVHVTARHAAGQMTRGQILNVGAGILDASTQGTSYNAIIREGAGMGIAAWQARYGRGNELQADEIGMEYMSSLGYAPQGAVELQETFVKLSEGKNPDIINGLFASHPPSQERVAANRKHAERFSGNLRNREAFLKATAQIRKDKAAYQLNQQALQALQSKELDKALSLAEKAIAMQPKENQFWETQAHVYVAKQQNDAALKAFDKAIQLNPNYFKPLLGRGSLLLASGNPARAEKDLLASRALLNTPVTNYFLGQAKLQQGDKTNAIAYFKIAASAGGNVGTAAQQQLDQLGVSSAP